MESPDPMLAVHAKELRRDLLITRMAGNVAGSILIGLAALAWQSGSGWWFSGYLAGSAVFAVVINYLSAYTRERQHARDLVWAERLHDLAVHDELTGLYNRRQFNLTLQQWVAAAREFRESDVVLAIADLDGLKQINDTLGHAAGDVAIRMAAGALAATAPASAIVSRLGGDEFAVLARLPHGAEAEFRARLCAAVARAPFAPASPDGPALSACVGIARLQPGADGDALFRAADSDLYAEKAARALLTSKAA